LYYYYYYYVSILDFIGTKGDGGGGGGNNWSYKTRKATNKTTHSFFYRLDALPATQPTCAQMSFENLHLQTDLKKDFFY